MSGFDDTLLDTSFLLRYAHQDEPLHRDVVESLKRLIGNGGAPCLVSQTLMEFWVVSTLPKAVNGAGMTPAEVRAEIDSLLQTFRMLSDPPDLFPRWLNLCTAHNVRGRPAHDARLIAAIDAHGINRLLTLNPGDFKRFTHIVCLTPFDVP